MAMLNRFFYSSIFCLGCSLGTLTPYASYAQNCNAPPEMITQLFYPELGSYTVWDKSYGEARRREIFTTSASLEDGSILAVGEMRHLPEVSPSLMVVLFDKRGRKVWEKYHSIGRIKNVVKVLSHEKGYVVLVNRAGDPDKKTKDYATLVFLDEQAKVTIQKDIGSKSYNITATDILYTKEETGNIVLSVTESELIGKGDEAVERKKATIRILDKKGNDLSRREYMLGINSEILSIKSLELSEKANNYIATGYFENDSKQKIGWVLRLSSDAAYIWHREFSRGKNAIISDAFGYKNEDIIAGGTIDAANSDQTGAWLMRLGGIDGEVKWERYYYSEKPHYLYKAQDVVVNKDGLISFLMQAKKMEKTDDELERDQSDVMSYAHLLNVSPRGITLSGDAYFKGKGAYVNEMKLDIGGQYVLSGYAWQTAQKVLEEYTEENSKPASEVMLPKVEVSQKTKDGLALLRGKTEEKKLEEEKLDSDSIGHGDKDQDLDQNAWIMIGAAPDTYIDPCK
ncbi:MAG: hypothetical protein OEY94_01845 [Alphaproteobacteria bacterium]|nr:hypothetical protein [Alphaproteobacteria bacterium]